jgi:acyl-CoA dehydrogenase
MDFDLTIEQRMLKDAVRTFVNKECPKEYATEIDEKEEFPLHLFPKMAELGMLALPFPEKYGGLGGNVMDEVIIIEELSRGVAAAGLTYFLSVCFGGKSIEYFGNEEQKIEYLPKLCKGEIMFSLALTEPEGGTDILGSLRSAAESRDGAYFINGQKTFITGAHVADFLVTLVRTDENAPKKAEGLSVFLVDTKSPGIEMHRLKKLGIKAIGSNEIFFTDVKVPRENLLGGLNKGWYQIVSTLNNERVALAGLCVGLAQAAFEEALQYAKKRIAFGKPIGQFQAIQHYLAEMATSIESARLLTYKAAWLQSLGRENAVESAMAKLIASETAFDAATKGMRIFGGYGYIMEYPIQRLLRDSVLFLFTPITNEMIKNFIGESLRLPKSY